jgi:hypothetical protein
MTELIRKLVSSTLAGGKMPLSHKQILIHYPFFFLPQHPITTTSTGNRHQNDNDNDNKGSRRILEPLVCFFIDNDDNSSQGAATTGTATIAKITTSPCTHDRPTTLLGK